MKEKFSKLLNVYKKYGIVGFFKKIYAYFAANYLHRLSLGMLFNPNKYRRQIRNILESDTFDRIILWRSDFGYSVPLFQRPQHIANNLAKNRCLVLYEVTTMTDKVKSFKPLCDNLYLVNFNNILLNNLLMSELKKTDKPKYIQLYSTDWKLSAEKVQAYMNEGYGFIYEYIDDLSPDIAGTKTLPKNITDKYELAMSNTDVFVVVTADLLKDDVVKRRGEKNLAVSSNGVDYSFFGDIDDSFEFMPEFKAVLEKGKPIVCYYGALAKWFDYNLVKKIASRGKYSVVLFGVKYDEAYDRNMKGVDNVYFLGSVDYGILKNYAAKCDVLTIPFLINDVTKATSPVKLFEYMALRKPIVTTDMNECRKYKSVLRATDHGEFLDMLDKAMELRNDKEYIELLDAEARANDWSEKAKAMVDLLSRSE